MGTLVLRVGDSPFFSGMRGREAFKVFSGEEVRACESRSDESWNGAFVANGLLALIFLF